jgi:ubiquinol oxidase
MEELGGNEKWFDRFIAQHMAIGYFWFAVTLYFVNPTFAYNFNEGIEEEACETYSRFLAENEDFLKSQPAPVAAQDYYLGGDLYSFDCMSKHAGPSQRPRPTMETLFDTFSAIRDDEAEHVMTMIAMQEAN